MGNSNGFFSSLGQYFEKSLIIDLGTIGTLGLNFFVLQQHFDFGDSLLQVSGDITVIAAQLSGIMVMVYLAETLADKHKSSGRSHY